MAMKKETLSVAKAVFAADAEIEDAAALVKLVELAAGKDLAPVFKMLEGQGNVKRRMGTVKQAAELLGVGHQSVEKLARAGKIFVVKISARKVRYSLDDCERLAGITD